MILRISSFFDGMFALMNAVIMKESFSLNVGIMGISSDMSRRFIGLTVSPVRFFFGSRRLLDLCINSTNPLYHDFVRYFFTFSHLMLDIFVFDPSSSQKPSALEVMRVPVCVIFTVSC